MVKMAFQIFHQLKKDVSVVACTIRDPNPGQHQAPTFSVATLWLCQNSY